MKKLTFMNGVGFALSSDFRGVILKGISTRHESQLIKRRAMNLKISKNPERPL